MAAILPPYPSAFPFLGDKLLDTFNFKERCVWLTVSESLVHGQLAPNRNIMAEGLDGIKMLSS